MSVCVECGSDEKCCCGPRPEVKRLCRVCQVKPQDVDANRVIVSPRGTAHTNCFTQSEITDCGRDATKPMWWWPL